MERLRTGLATLALAVLASCGTSEDVALDAAGAPTDAAGQGDSGAVVDALPRPDAAPAADAGPGFDGAVAVDASVANADAMREFDAARPDAAGPPDASRPDADLGPLSCEPSAYTPYLRANPHVFAATFGRLDSAGRTYLCADLVALESTGAVTVAEPAASATCSEPVSCTYITPTADERNRILAAKYAHAMWLDRNRLVPWALSSYSTNELDGLLDPAVLFRNGTHFMSVVDHSPSEAWAYVVEQGLVGSTADETINRVISDLRSTDAAIDFVHGIGTGSNPDPVNTAYTLDEALRTWVDRGFGTSVRVSRKGCHTMSRITLALLRSANVPGVEVHDGQWFGNGHSTPTWPILGTVVPHGDHLYGATLLATPTVELRAPESFFSDPANTAVCGSDAGCLGTRHSSLNAIAYPARYTMRRCCDPGTYGYATCHDYLTSNFSPSLSAAEITTAAAALSSSCSM